MSIEASLMARSGAKCELCAAEQALEVYAVPASPSEDADHSVLLCADCRSQLQAAGDSNRWRCLSDSMWSPVPAVQVLAWRQLHFLIQQGEHWAQEQLDMLYLDDETRQWAEAGATHSAQDDDAEAPTLDSNGNPLQEGDSVTLIKDLEVKGAGFTAKRGTLVKGIRLTNNPLHIEGKVNGIQIVLVAAYLKKA